jgi:hypothetical protein
VAEVLEAVAAFTRCFNALDAHVEMSAVLSASAAEDDDSAPYRAPMDAPSRAPMAAPPPPPRLRSALLYAMWILSDPSHPRRSRSVRRETPRAPGTARRRLRAAALALLDALSERPAVLFAALPSDDRHHLLALLARRLEHSATAVRLSPSGRVRAADAHSAVFDGADAHSAFDGWRSVAATRTAPPMRG